MKKKKCKLGVLEMRLLSLSSFEANIFLKSVSS